MKKLTLLIAMLMATSAWSQNFDQYSEVGWIIYDGYSYTDDGCSTVTELKEICEVSDIKCGFTNYM